MFSSHEELFKFLLDGGAITNMDDSCPDCWISFYNGQLKYSDGLSADLDSLNHFASWRPVPIKNLTNYIHRVRHGQKSID